MSSAEATAARNDRDEPRNVKRDLRYLWMDVHFAGSTMKHAPDPVVEAASSAAGDVVDRIEDELSGEAARYRYALYACIAVIVMPGALAALAWSGLYWLPVRIQWFPFERGFYGLPWFSLYEWFAYLLLALFFVFGFLLVAQSHDATRRLCADYRRLSGAGDDARREFVEAVRSAGLGRTELVMRSSKVFAEYRAMLDAADADAGRADAHTVAASAEAPR